MILLTLPYPPSANRLWVRTKRGMRRSDEYIAWMEEAAWRIRGQNPKSIDGPYQLSIHVVRPDKRRRDIDNLIKPVSDALQHAGVVRDDCDCASVHARWAKEGAAVTAIVEPAEAIH